MGTLVFTSRIRLAELLRCQRRLPPEVMKSSSGGLSEILCVSLRRELHGFGSWAGEDLAWRRIVAKIKYYRVL